MEATSGTRKKRGTSFTPNTRLRYYRKMHHWTQEALANELSLLCGDSAHGLLTATMISNWERGEYKPSPFWQRKLCEFFETTPDDLGLIEKSSSLPTELPVSSPFYQ